MHIKSGFILNGVCVLWRGWLDLQRLEGFGCLEFDEYRAYLEDAMAKQQACNNPAPPLPIGQFQQLAPPALPIVPNSLARMNHQALSVAHLAHPSQPNVLGQLPTASVGQSVPPMSQSTLQMGLNTSCLGPTRSPPSDQVLPRHQAIKRAAPDDDQTQLDDVDVVSDTSAHDLEFPPRRLFKSALIAAQAATNHHHLNSHLHQRATRRV